ncbi:glycosyltransferase family 4 protein [Flavobacterium restrictum]|uniref:Glycosyltransferase n=1 Tax=Flavobacterium restrictum TaxID=2594428 RepID=A0A553E3H4_9FLAO|nr:glycosyltransferase [Flavobacterium restrictum]TRX39482.1 glycosyltransferase [Flavobacterium restrictum]
MEIIHVVLGKANPQRMNGVNKVVHQLATQQRSFGETVSVWGISKDGKYNFETRNFETRLFQKQRNPFAFSKELKSALVAKKGKAVFHLHGGWIPVYYSIAQFLYQHTIAFVFTPHGAYNTIAMKRSFWFKKVYFRFFEKRVLQHTTQIHCIGKSEVTGLNKIFKNKKSILLPYGYENKQKITLKDTTNGTIVFGFIGRLDIYTKGLDTLLKGFQKFHKNHPDSQLWIVGDSNEKAALEKQIKTHSLSECVTLYGSKFGKEKEDLLQQMDVFVHPSRNEGLPLSVIEAASFGKPCIVTDATNIGNLVEKYQAGKTIYYQCSKQLEAAMNAVFKGWQIPLDFLEMQRNSIKMVEENYNWEKLITQFHTDLYKI